MQQKVLVLIIKIEVNKEYEVFASNGCTNKVLVDLEGKNAPVLSYSNGVGKFIKKNFRTNVRING